jgi:GTPase SAR1 family protein
VGALVIFDINNHGSFEHVKEWLGAVKERAEVSVQVGLIGHKADSSKRSVSKKEAEKFAEAHNIFYAETTVNEPETIRKAFHKLLTSKISCEF